MTNETIQRSLEAVVLADGRGEIRDQGEVIALRAESDDELRALVILRTAELARVAGGPLRLRVLEADGAFPLVVFTDGDINEEGEPTPVEPGDLALWSEGAPRRPGPGTGANRPAARQPVPAGAGVHAGSGVSHPGRGTAAAAARPAPIAPPGAQSAPDGGYAAEYGDQAPQPQVAREEYVHATVALPRPGMMRDEAFLEQELDALESAREQEPQLSPGAGQALGALSSDARQASERSGAGQAPVPAAAAVVAAAPGAPVAAASGTQAVPASTGRHAAVAAQPPRASSVQASRSAAAAQAAPAQLPQRDEQRPRTAPQSVPAVPPAASPAEATSPGQASQPAEPVPMTRQQLRPPQAPGVQSQDASQPAQPSPAAPIAAQQVSPAPQGGTAPAPATAPPASSPAASQLPAAGVPARPASPVAAVPPAGTPAESAPAMPPEEQDGWKPAFPRERRAARREQVTRQPAQQPSAAPQQLPAARPGGANPTVDDFFADKPQRAAVLAEDGWRGSLRRGSGGLLKLRPSTREQMKRDEITAIRRSFQGHRSIVVMNPKGGAHKTTTTLMIAAMFGMHRGGYTLAWDNNETRGTLGWRSHRGEHDRTAVDLLHQLSHFEISGGATISDVDRFVRNQGDANFDVLASDDDAASAAIIDDDAFSRLYRTLSRFYRVIVIDTGNNMRASNWEAALEIADQLVIVSTAREDTAASAAWLADGLAERGYAEKLANAVTILSSPSAKEDRNLQGRLRDHFSRITRDVVEVPYDHEFVGGGELDIASLRPETIDAWRHVAAVIARGL